MRKKNAAIYLSVVAVTILVYLLHFHGNVDGDEQIDIVFQRLYFIPIILAGIWFGKKSALLVTVITGLLVLPNIFIHWGGFSGGDLNRLAQLPVFFAVGWVLGTVAELQKKEQKRARESEKLAAVGRSLAAAAHDMRTPLVAIGGLVTLVRKHLPESSPDRDKLGKVIKEVERLEMLLSNMLDFSRPLELHCERTDVRSLIEDCIEIARSHAEKHKVRLDFDIAADLTDIECDPQRIKQAVINLLINAVQASPEGEKVLVRGYIRGGNTVFEVIDCGCGVPAELRESIFQPFFTTRKDGTGLGLPIVGRIIDAHEGHIAIENNFPRGAIMRITLSCRGAAECCPAPCAALERPAA